MTASPSTIKQRTVAVDLGGRSVDVRRMYWKDAREFLALLANHLGALRTALDVDLVAALPDLADASGDLLERLLLCTTGLSREEIGALDVGQVGALVTAAVDLNLGDELKNSLAGAGARLSALTGVKIPTTFGASSTPTSSTPATPPSSSTVAPSSTSTSSSDTPAS